MVIKIIIEGILLGALLVLVCAIGIRNGAVNMVFLYHQDVQDRCVNNGLITKDKIKRNMKLFKGLGIPLYFIFVLVSAYVVNGARVHTLRIVFDELEALGLSKPVSKPELKNRGRKPKPEDQTEQKPKRKRGRPRKDATQSAGIL